MPRPRPAMQHRQFTSQGNKNKAPKYKNCIINRITSIYGAENWCKSRRNPCAVCVGSRHTVFRIHCSGQFAAQIYAANQDLYYLIHDQVSSDLTAALVLLPCLLSPLPHNAFL